MQRKQSRPSTSTSTRGALRSNRPNDTTPDSIPLTTLMYHRRNLSAVILALLVQPAVATSVPGSGPQEFVNELLVVLGGSLMSGFVFGILSKTTNRSFQDVPSADCSESCGSRPRERRAKQKWQPWNTLNRFHPLRRSVPFRRISGWRSQGEMTAHRRLTEILVSEPMQNGPRFLTARHPLSR